MTTHVDGVGAFSCVMEVPVMLDDDHQQCISIVGVFRGGIAAEEVDRWVMHPNGTPRTDRELAAEVLLEIRESVRSEGQTAPHALDVADILELDKAAAIVVSTFLAALPRAAGRYWTKGHLLSGLSRLRRKAASPARPQSPPTWREV